MNELYVIYKDYSDDMSAAGSDKTFRNRWSKCKLATDKYNNGIIELTNKLLEIRGAYIIIKKSEIPQEITELLKFFKDCEYFVINDSKNNCHYTLHKTQEDSYYVGSISNNFLKLIVKLSNIITIK